MPENSLNANLNHLRLFGHFRSCHRRHLAQGGPMPRDTRNLYLAKRKARKLLHNSFGIITKKSKPKKNSRTIEHYCAGIDMNLSKLTTTPGDKDLVCSICEKPFKIGLHLIQHIQKEHESGKLKCSECGIKFTSTKMLAEE